MSGQNAAATNAGDWRAAGVIARRELRDSLARGLGGFRIMIACLALGVAAIAAVGAARLAVEEAISRDAQRIHGGDIEARLLYREAGEAEQAYFAELGETARIAEMRSMARVGDRRQLAALKAVDDRYPLYGGFLMAPVLDHSAAYGPRDGVFGAVVDQAFLDATGLDVGGRFQLNRTDFEARAVVTEEVDRGVGLMSLGPRIMISHQGLEATGLNAPGALVTWRYRIRLPDPSEADASLAAIEARFDNPGWRLRTSAAAAPQLRRVIDRLAMFLTLASLAALLVGGVGAANAVKAYMDGRARTVAILKCLGAPARVIFRAYLLQVAVIAVIATTIGAVIGGLAPLALARPLGATLGLRLEIAPALAPMATAVAFGLVTALLFAVWPLATAEKASAARLIGGSEIGLANVRPSGRRLWLLAAAAMALVALAVLTAADKRVAGAFVAGAAGAALLFLAATSALLALIRRAPRHGGPLWRLALSGLTRPGAPTRAIALSLGLGLAALTATTMTQGAFSNQIDDTMAEDAPTFFFVDIQPHQRELFRETMAGVPGARVGAEAPMLRARIVKIAGVPAEEAAIADDARWAIRNERGLSYAAAPPENAKLVAGSWWPEKYAGPPLVSLDANIANGFGIGIGDSITFNLLGREITGEIANLRAVDYGSFAMNFSTVFNPDALNRAPHTILATGFAPPEAEAAVTRAVTDAMPNVTAIRVKDAVDIAKQMLDRIGGALAGVAAISVAAGALTLAGAVAASQRRRVREAILLKTAGADRGQIVKAQTIEFGLIGLLTAIMAVAVGALGAWAIVTFLLQAEWKFQWGAALLPAALALSLALAAGGLSIWRALKRPAGQMLRNA